MSSVDQILEREVRRGMTRQDLIKRAGALGLLVTAGSFGPLTEAAFARTQIKRGGTFRYATPGGPSDFIDGEHIVAKSDQARRMATFDPLTLFDEQAIAYNDLVRAGAIDPCLGQVSAFEEIGNVHQQMAEGRLSFGNAAILIGAPTTGLGAKGE